MAVPDVVQLEEMYKVCWQGAGTPQLVICDEDTLRRAYFAANDFWGWHYFRRAVYCFDIQLNPSRLPQ